MEALVNLRTVKRSLEDDNDLRTIEEEVEAYPYGLRLFLNNKLLKKLGIDISDLSIKDVLQVVGKAFITEIRTDEMVSGKENGSISLQITDLSLLPIEAEQKKRLREAMKTIV